MAAANFSPVIAGMKKSVMIRSNLPGWKRARACAPLLALSTRWPSISRIIVTASQTKASSSTTRICRLSEGHVVIGETKQEAGQSPEAIGEPRAEASHWKIREEIGFKSGGRVLVCPQASTTNKL